MAVYTVSACVGTLITPASTDLSVYTCPVGKTFVLKSILAYASTGTPQLTMRLKRSGTSYTFYGYVIPAALVPVVQETRVVFEAGDELLVFCNTNNVVRVSLAGFELDNP